MARSPRAIEPRLKMPPVPARNPDLHGFVPDRSDVALLLIDVINDLDFEQSEQMLPFALDMARNLQKLKKRAREHNIPVVYVNDNFGRWQSDLSRLIEHCSRPDAVGRPIVEMLKPAEDDYFVLKPKHSGFYSTVLDVLLDYLQVKTVILGGLAGNICILFTANDAYMRDFNVIVPADCIASNTREINDQAIEQIRRICKADTRPSADLELRELRGR